MCSFTRGIKVVTHCYGQYTINSTFLLVHWDYGAYKNQSVCPAKRKKPFCWFSQPLVPPFIKFINNAKSLSIFFSLLLHGSLTFESRDVICLTSSLSEVPCSWKFQINLVLFILILKINVRLTRMNCEKFITLLLTTFQHH